MTARASAADERNQEIVQRYLDGASLPALAERYGVSRQRIEQIAKAAGVHRAPVYLMRAAEALTPEHIAAYEAGLSARAIARDTPIHFNTLTRYLRLLGKQTDRGSRHFLPTSVDKPCRVCGVWLPLDQFYALSAKYRHMGDGHMHKCKDCHYQGCKEQRARQQEVTL